MSLYDPGDYPAPNAREAKTLATLPIQDVQDGYLFDRAEPNDDIDAAFKAWDAPLVWHHQPSQIKVDNKFRNGTRAVHFAFEERVPETVWQKGWHLWYDHALVLRKRMPRDMTLSATFGFEEVTTGYGSDNVDHQRPWVGLVARMQDLRRYYFLTLEYPNRMVLYKRHDKLWSVVGEAQVHLDVWVPYRLTWQLTGDCMRVWLDEAFLFTAHDSDYEDGYAGIRATTTSFAYDLHFYQSPEQAALTPEIAPPPIPKLPKATVARSFDLAELGELSKGIRFHATMVSSHFATAAGEPQLLVKLWNRSDDINYALVDLHGQTIWTAAIPGADRMIPTRPLDDGCTDIIAVANHTLYRVCGKTGGILKTVVAPVAPDGREIRAGNGPTATADLDGDGQREAFFLTCGADQRHVWAYNDALEELWYANVPSGLGHGGHLVACDVDGDGNEEVAAGACLLSSTGEIIWQQDEVIRRLLCPNGGHIDSMIIGFFDGPDAPPTIHCASSSAGHIVLNARTGALLAAHPQGHAQSAGGGSVIPNTHGVQAWSVNRWSCYGVAGIYAGQSKRLRRLQAGFTYQNMVAVNWDGSGLEYLLVADARDYRGLYDHLGRRVLDLESFVPGWDVHERRHDRLNVMVAPLLGGGCDNILLRVGTEIVILAPAITFEAGQRIFTPYRRDRVSWPRWTIMGEDIETDLGEASSFN